MEGTLKELMASGEATPGTSVFTAFISWQPIDAWVDRKREIGRGYFGPNRLSFYVLLQPFFYGTYQPQIPPCPSNLTNPKGFNILPATALIGDSTTLPILHTNIDFGAS